MQEEIFYRINVIDVAKRKKMGFTLKKSNRVYGRATRLYRWK